ncbi:MAG: hypothetical protein ACYC21_04190 [Eubacteriales bacterium]
MCRNAVRIIPEWVSGCGRNTQQQAVEGKLVPQNENDESAAVLLSKIKAEKEKLIKEGKIKKDKPFAPIEKVYR